MKKLRLINVHLLAAIGAIGLVFAGIALKNHHLISYYVLVFSGWFLILMAIDLKGDQN